MKKIYFLLVLVLLHFVVSAKIYAVIVGVSSYDNPSINLHYAAKDAEVFYKYLKDNNPGADLIMITDEDATKTTILSYLKSKFSQASSADEVIFFFSGHGSPGKFVCYDSKIGGNYISHDEVKAVFKSSSAKIKLCFADACFSGSIKKTKSEYAKSKANKENLKTISDFEIIIFMSSQPWQPSKEKGSLGQGVFTYYIIEGLKGYADADNSNSITAKELYVYVRNNVMASTNNEQTPIMFGKFDPLVVVR